MALHEAERGPKLTGLPESHQRLGWDQRLHRQYLAHPGAVKWALNLALSLALVAVVYYPREQFPEEEFGVGEVAEKTVKVPQDLDVEDPAATVQRQEDAAAAVQSVYDLDTKAESLTEENVRKFFQGFRELNLAAAEGGGEEVIAVPPAFREEREQELQKILGVPLEPELGAALKRQGFSTELESAVSSLLRAAYSQPIVISKNLLFKEKDKGIVVRKLPQDERNALSDFSGIQDLAEAKAAAANAVQTQWKDQAAGFRLAAGKLVALLIAPTLTFNKDETEKVRSQVLAQVSPVFYKLKRGEIIVRKGDRISEGQVAKIKALSSVRVPWERPFVYAGLFLISLLSLATVVHFASRNIRKFSYQPRDLVFLAAVLVVSLASLKLVEQLAMPIREAFTGLPEEVEFHYLIALAGGAMLVRLVLNSEVALVYSLFASLFGALVVGRSLSFAFYTLVGSLVAAGEVGQCRERATILRGGLVLGLANVVLVLFVALAENEFLEVQALLYNGLFAFLGGLFASILITGVVPLVESVFNYATDIKLLELLNQDHPLLKEMSIHAPGTHQHSLAVANLAESAAEAIPANPLLTRVVAMYHDIGKLHKAHYFAENQWDHENPHDKLRPSMSALILTNHVKEGVELGEKHRLPQAALDCIGQHHGTSLIKYFYEKAKEQENPEVDQVDELDFRYSGPKPQLRETGIIMLADAVESAARSMREPNPSRIQGMVQNIINRIFADGQLDECELTLKDLNAIAKAFNKTLGAMYHQRPDYPTPVEKGAVPLKRKSDADQDKRSDKKSREGREEGADLEDSDEYLKRLGM